MHGHPFKKDRLRDESVHGSTHSGGTKHCRSSGAATMTVVSQRIARAGRRATWSNTVLWSAALIVVLLASMTVAVTIGPAHLSMGDVWASLAHHAGLGESGLTRIEDGIVWQIRLPRALTAAAVGAGLAVSGAVMQALTRNSLADPFLLGLSSGASFGAVLVLILGASIVLPLAAFVGSLTAMTITLLLARSLGIITPTRTVLAGLAVSSLAGALTSLVIFWSATGDSYREILNWLLGSLAGADWSAVAIAVGAMLVIGVPVFASGRILDAFAYGDTAAAALGVHVPRARWGLLTATALLTGAMVAVSGSIGFVGLVLPNAVRLVVGAQHRLLLPLSAIVGAIFMVWVDTAARNLFAPRELPVGIITVLIGAPIFALLLWRNRGNA